MKFDYPVILWDKVLGLGETFPTSLFEVGVGFADCHQVNHTSMPVKT